MDIIAQLTNTPLFDSLAPEELREVAARVKLVRVRALTTLFREGDPGSYVCFVLKGELEVLKASQSGEQVSIAVLGRGRSIGEMAIIDRFTRSATVRATQDSQLAVLARADFELLLQEHPAVGIKILKSLARLLSLNLRKTSSALADHLLPTT